MMSDDNESDDQDTFDPTKHYLVGSLMNGSVVTSVKETHLACQEGYIKIKREVLLKNGCGFWKTETYANEDDFERQQSAGILSGKEAAKIEERRRVKIIQERFAREKVRAKKKVEKEQAKLLKSAAKSKPSQEDANDENESQIEAAEVDTAKNKAEEAKPFKLVKEEQAKGNVAEEKARHEEEEPNRKLAEEEEICHEEEAKRKVAEEEEIRQEEEPKRKVAGERVCNEEEEAKRKLVEEEIRQGEEAKRKVAEERARHEEEEAERKVAKEKENSQEEEDKRKVAEERILHEEGGAIQKIAGEEKARQEEEVKRECAEENDQKKLAEDQDKARQEAAEKKHGKGEEPKRKVAEEDHGELAENTAEGNDAKVAEENTAHEGGGTEGEKTLGQAKEKVNRDFVKKESKKSEKKKKNESKGTKKSDNRDADAKKHKRSPKPLLEAEPSDGKKVEETVDETKKKKDDVDAKKQKGSTKRHLEAEPGDGKKAEETAEETKKKKDDKKSSRASNSPVRKSKWKNPEESSRASKSPVRKKKEKERAEERATKSASPKGGETAELLWLDEEQQNPMVGESTADAKAEPARGNVDEAIHEPKEKEGVEKSATRDASPTGSETAKRAKAETTVDESSPSEDEKKGYELSSKLLNVKKSNPTFAKIMGVWVNREEKSTYVTPLVTVKRPSEKPPVTLTLRDMVKKWEAACEADIKTKKKGPGEGPPEKLRNVCAETLDITVPFKAPVFKKSEKEKKWIQKSFDDNFVFDDLTPSEIGPIVDAFKRVEYEKGETIAVEGEAEGVYSIVQSGEVTFHKGDNQIGSAGAGEAFGETALLYSCPRAVSVKCGDHQTVVFELDHMHFRRIVREQILRSEEEKLKLLKSVPMFMDLDEIDLLQLSHAMVQHTFNEGDNLSTIFKEAPFCLVQEGLVVATDATIGPATIGPGESFGEEAFTKERKVARHDVKATSDGVAFTIDRQSFEKVFGDYNRVSLKHQDKETLSGVKAIRAAKLAEPELDLLVRQITDTKFKAGEEIFVLDTKITPAMYLVREGQVEIVRKNGREEMIFPGGYFGHEYLNITSKGSRDVVPEYVIAKSYATAIEDTVCGMFTLQELAAVSGRLVVNTDLESTYVVALEDLKRHRILGEGQFGTVFLVTDKKAERPEPYALKIQYTDDPERPESAECIRLEIKMMRSIQHPFIIEVINTYEEEDSISMLLSLAPGGELFDIIHVEDGERGWISGIAEEFGLFYSAVIADTLAFMHRQKFVYRDLKPENVLIDKDGYPVITDFGFAKKVEGKTYTLCGTPNYVAPEVIANRGHNMSADNWSLGVLVYELIDGENPFWTEGMDQQTLFEMIGKALYYVPDERKFSADARDFICRLLEKDPSKRLGTFREKDILEHEWFSEIDIEMLREKKVKAPWVPDPIQLGRG